MVADVTTNFGLEETTLKAGQTHMHSMAIVSDKRLNVAFDGGILNNAVAAC